MEEDGSGMHIAQDRARLMSGLWPISTGMTTHMSHKTNHKFLYGDDNDSKITSFVTHLTDQSSRRHQPFCMWKGRVIYSQEFFEDGQLLCVAL